LQFVILLAAGLLSGIAPPAAAHVLVMRRTGSHRTGRASSAPPSGARPTRASWGWSRSPPLRRRCRPPAASTTQCLTDAWAT